MMNCLHSSAVSLTISVKVETLQLTPKMQNMQDYKVTEIQLICFSCFGTALETSGGWQHLPPVSSQLTRYKCHSLSSIVCSITTKVSKSITKEEESEHCKPDKC